MTFKDYQRGAKKIELELKKGDRLKDLCSQVHQAESRFRIHELLNLPDPVRVRAVQEVRNFRIMFKERLEAYMAGNKLDDELKETLTDIIGRIDDVDSIDAELRELERAA